MCPSVMAKVRRVMPALEQSGWFPQKRSRVSQKTLGIRLARKMGMAVFTTMPDASIQKVEWLHWLFVQGERVLSCDVDVRGDGVYAVTLFPLWAPDHQITETFRRPIEAFRWHEEMTRRLQAAGWLLFEGGVVTNAA